MEKISVLCCINIFEQLSISLFIACMCSKGEIENAVKFLEMYVSVAEKAGLQNSLAKACSAIGIMYNTLVSKPQKQNIDTMRNTVSTVV